MKPIDQNIAWPFTDEAIWVESANGRNSELLYSRNTPQPIVLELEQTLARLEHAETGVSFSSGMGAIYASLISTTKPGSKVVAFDTLYGGTFSLLKHMLPKWGVQCELFAATQSDAFFDAVRDADVVYLETPSNPMLQQLDIEAIVEAAKAAGAIVMCDNTVATPFAQNPILLGADVVIHSATKFLGGHVDALAGVVCCSESIAQQLRTHRELIGSVLAPQAAHLIMRGLQSFELRMRQATSNAKALATFFSEHPTVNAVFYPGVNAPRCKSLKNDVALLSIDLASADKRSQLLAAISPIKMMSTLGSIDTIVGIPETTSHVECTKEEREQLGISEGLLRISMGIEPCETLLDIFSQGLEAID